MCQGAKSGEDLGPGSPHDRYFITESSSRRSSQLLPCQVLSVVPPGYPLQPAKAGELTHLTRFCDRTNMSELGVPGILVKISYFPAVNK